jgi:Leucine-rich repeat (LRR) protein
MPNFFDHIPTLEIQGIFRNGQFVNRTTGDAIQMKAEAPVRIIVEDSYVLPSDRKGYHEAEQETILQKGKEAYFDMKINGLDYRFFVRMLEDLQVTQKRGKSARFSKSACEVYNYSPKTLDNFKTIEADSFSHAYKRISEIYRFGKSSHTCNAFTTFFDAEKEISFDVIREVALHKEVSEVELNRKWWNELSPTWKQTFLKNIPLDFEPNDFQLVDAITNTIYYGRNEKLRKSIGQLIVSKNFRSHVNKWFSTLNTDLQNEVKTFIFQLVEGKHIEDILNLEKVDCSGNLAIQNLEVVTQLSQLKVLDCKNTGIQSLDDLVRCKQLVEINFNITNVKSLAPLYAIESLRKVSCIQTNIKENEVEDFKASCLDVEVDWRASEGSLF